MKHICWSHHICLSGGRNSFGFLLSVSLSGFFILPSLYTAIIFQIRFPLWNHVTYLGRRCGFGIREPQRTSWLGRRRMGNVCFLISGGWNRQKVKRECWSSTSIIKQLREIFFIAVLWGFLRKNWVLQLELYLRMRWKCPKQPWAEVRGNKRKARML